jgi:succinate dehydrogenase / fumarate reductase flavoprotein subunit
MERYSPTLLDLAPRDIIARAIVTEIQQGRGIKGDGSADDYVHLDATHLGKDLIESKLPDIADFVRTYLNIDPAEEPMPVHPTAHYAMGGIPTDLDGRVFADEKGAVIEGLYAAGECACVSVHGANRLGTNSLVDLIVYGRRAGQHISQFVEDADLPSLPQEAAEPTRARLARLRESTAGPDPECIRQRMENVMTSNVGIYRNAGSMSEAVAELKELRGMYNEVRCRDSSQVFNTELLEIVELGNLLDNAYLAATSAHNRQESRGAHARDDFPERDDANWLKHTLAWLEDDAVRIGYKEVDVSRWDPKPRKY